MILWLIFALMTAAAILAVLWPLGRDSRAVGQGGSDLVVYKDQLQEIDRDRAAGLIGESEAEAARLEVSRRLLAAAPAEAKGASETAAGGRSLWRRRAAAVTALAILPLGPVCLYIALGSPNVPGQPAFARANARQGTESIASLVSQVEAHLARNPNDGAGWEVIAPVYMRLGRYDDAVAARRKSLALNGESATRESDLGEALAAAANGVVTAQAKAAFDRAVAADPREAKARYFLGLAAKQDGKTDEAASIWRALIADAPTDAPWLGFVRESLAQLSDATAQTAASARAPGPTAGEVAQAAMMGEADRTEMIRGMVARLADRLHANGADVDGWVRLVRAYVVLGDRDKAKDAAAEARRALADRPDEIKRIDDLVKGLGLEG
jgi:cytochrome c-type biogenesis protein CcmH